MKTCEMEKEILLEQVTSIYDIRPLKEWGVQLIEAKIRSLGYLPDSPIIVCAKRESSTYELIAGHHRLEAARRAGCKTIPAVIVEMEDEAAKLRLARASNEAAEAVIPTTFVDDAELIWRLSDQGWTQAKAGETLGWSRERVRDFIGLRKIDRQAWEVVGATWENGGAKRENDEAPEDGAGAPFTEKLLRAILPLTPPQQLELVRDLSEGKIRKGKFKSLAVAYRGRNEMAEVARKRLADLRHALDAGVVSNPKEAGG